MLAGKHFLSATLLCLFVAGFLTTAQSGPKAPSLSDEDMTRAIETAFLIDDAVSSHQIDVSAEDGIVTLSGTVDNLLAEERAVESAQSVKGVRSVIERLEVKPVFRPDAEIHQDAQAALLEDPATDSYEVDVAVEAGVVTLTGTVQSYAERMLSARVVKGVRGVREVANDIKVEYKHDRSDSEIEADVERRMQADLWLNDDFITVTVQDGDVTLNGSVGSAFERRRAENMSWVLGVNSVNGSDLRIEWWNENDGQRVGNLVVRPDKEIEESLEDAFLHDPRVSAFKVDASVDRGSVTLTGTVDNLSAKQAAEQDARNSVGVWRVKNHIRVRPAAQSTDIEIAADVKVALTRSPFPQLSDITVSLHNGKARLYGDLESAFLREQAEAIVASVPGVIDVANHLVVSYVPPTKSDWEIQADIQDELFWSPFVDSEEITVRVHQGVAQLSGAVDSWFEYGKAIENAREGGAQGVNTAELKVKNAPGGPASF